MVAEIFQVSFLTSGSITISLVVCPKTVFTDRINNVKIKTLVFVVVREVLIFNAQL
jgi:hypothetical protein